MPIPESQLDIWSHQGSVTQSRDTYNTIKRILESSITPYFNKSVSIFLQGSYGNDTNIYSESDVDIVIALNDCWYDDLEGLPEEDKIAYKKAFTDAIYGYREFKRDVLKVLTDEYGGGVRTGDKAIAIVAGGSRRKADVIPAVQYRRYYRFKSKYDQSYIEGICFHDVPGNRIMNYPKQHSENLTLKNQRTNGWLKPMVRVLKNLRGMLVKENIIEPGLAPSYYLECLLYNVPSDKFGVSYQDTFVNAFGWIQSEADKKKFVCANEQYLLLWDNSPTSWPTSKCDQFLLAAVELWNQW